MHPARGVSISSWTQLPGIFSIGLHVRGTDIFTDFPFWDALIRQGSERRLDVIAVCGGSRDQSAGPAAEAIFALGR